MERKSLGRVKGDTGASVWIKYNSAPSDTSPAPKDYWEAGLNYIGIATGGTKPTTGYQWSLFIPAAAQPANDLVTNDSARPLSAAMGKKLQDEKQSIFGNVAGASSTQRKVWATPKSTAAGAISFVALDKNDVGLSSLDNVRQYSTSNEPPIRQLKSYFTIPSAYTSNQLTALQLIGYGFTDSQGGYWTYDPSFGDIWVPAGPSYLYLRFYYITRTGGDGLFTVTISSSSGRPSFQIPADLKATIYVPSGKNFSENGGSSYVGVVDYNRTVLANTGSYTSATNTAYYNGQQYQFSTSQLKLVLLSD